MAKNAEVEQACKENLSLDRFTIPDLKCYLRERGQYVSGNKRQLIERTKGAYKLSKSDSQITDKEVDGLVHNDCKLTTAIGESYKHPSYIDNWSDDITLIPDVTDKDIFNYFVYKLGVKRQLKAKVMYDDRHVHKIQVNECTENDSHCFVRANIIPSMPSANVKQCPDYKAWVMLSTVTGCINSAECTCVAGFNGEGCNHVAALLYAVADISMKKKEGLLAPTSVKCKWNNPRKRKLTPKKSQQLHFNKSIHGKNTSMCEIVETPSIETSVNVERFRKRILKVNTNAGWLKNFKSDVKRPVVPKLHNIPFCYHKSVDLTSDGCKTVFKDYFSSLSLTEEQCVSIESLTRSQNDSDFWFETRSERLTASNFGRICKMKPETNSDSLLKDLMQYRTFVSSHTEYGKKHEAAARRSYLKHMKCDHPGITVKKCGLLTTPELPYLGASPDGFVNCTHCEHSNGMLEIKCPASMLWRMQTPKQCASNTKFYCFLNDSGNVTLKRDHSYYYQVQGQLGISGRPWCDFVVWTCMGISVERIEKDDSFFTQMVDKLKTFYITAFIPELFSRRVLQDMQSD